MSDNPKEVVKYNLEKQSDCVRIVEIKIIKGQFYERMELFNVPFDLQLLNVVLKTKIKPNRINLLSSVNGFFLNNIETKRTFVDQQKWYLFNILFFLFNFYFNYKHKGGYIIFAN